MIDQEVEQALDAFAKAVLHRLNEKARLQSPRRIADVTLRFPDTGNPTYIPEERVLWGHFIADLFDPLRTTLPEIEHFGRLLFEKGVYHRQLPLTDHTGTSVTATYERAQSFFVPTELLGIVINYLDHWHSFDYDAEKFKEEFERYRRSWSLPTTPITVTVPLLRFSTDASPIRLPSELTIEPLSGADKTAAWPKAEWERMGFRTADFAGARFHVTGTYQRARAERTTPSAEVERLSYCVLTALRLIHDGHVTAPAGVLYTPPVVAAPSLDAFWGNLRVPYGEPSRGGTDYVLTSEECPTFLALFNELERLSAGSQLKPLEVALRRFNQSYTRDTYDDIIIDLVIALESSLLFGIDEKQGMRYRMAVRGAALLRARRDPRNTFSIPSTAVRHPQRHRPLWDHA